VTVSLAVTACGLSVTGVAPPEGGPASGGDDAGATTAVPDRTYDGSVNLGDGCAPLLVQDDFSVSDSKTWFTVEKANRAAGEVTLLAARNMHAYGQLFLATPSPMGTFRATFRFRAERTGSNFDYGDGFAFLWLDTGGNRDLIKDGTEGSGLGVPSGLGGWGFIFDTYSNSSTEPKSPYLALIGLEPGKVPGGYSWWRAQSSPTPDGFLAEWHTVVVSVAGGTASVVVDQMNPLSAPMPSDWIGHFGFTASSGGADPVVIHIDDVRIERPCAN
jgi:hypothetical protein